MSALVTPGGLVAARGREWVVLPGSVEGRLRLRPLVGGEDDATVIVPRLEREPPRPARFQPPDPSALGTSADALLLADAARLALRRGAGPFRSVGRVAFSPRAYQLVPLIMALGLDPVRLLIADDVGIGKTIEAGLVLRELWDRGEVRRASVLCPPHLVEQWTDELRTKFDLHAVAVTAASAPRLERGLALDESPFDAHPLTVVSLDYIKAERRRADFARRCPPFVIVDEAHASVGGGSRGTTQRHALLRALSAEPERHMVLLTATPHSGDAEAFDKLVGLLDPEFGEGGALRGEGRERLSRHLVQRRRIDVRDEGWGEDGEARAFPDHKISERHYELAGEHLAFHDAVLDHCLGVTTRASEDERGRRVAFWGTLALMRCVGSSPAAALATLRARRSGRAGGEGEEADALAPAMFDEDDGQLTDDDLEPALGDGVWRAENDGEIAELDALIKRAAVLSTRPEEDPKLRALIEETRDLLRLGHRPVVFCRFIATAEAVGAALRKALGKAQRVEVVTGRLSPKERRETVEAMADSDARILVATDCLSEGINLQGLFDAVVHHDLSWNPTRHQQREGRVDRFGQRSPVVRSLTLYGSNSAIDGAVLDVITRKADAIRAATGVSVNTPANQEAITSALMKAMTLRSGRTPQLAFNFAGGAATVEAAWRDAEENEKRTRAVFAQNRLRPAEVLPGWRRAREVLGGPREVERFTRRALRRFGVGMTDERVPTAELPEAVRERLAAAGLGGTLRVAITSDPEGHVALHRAHPLVAALADAILESALEGAPGADALDRAGCWRAAGTDAMYTLALLRVRHRVHPTRAAAAGFLLAEEIVPVLWRGVASEPMAVGAEALELLEREPGATLPEPVRRAQVERALARLASQADALAAVASARADQLAYDHDGLARATNRRARAADGRTRTMVEPVLPPDVLGLYVTLPEASA